MAAADPDDWVRLCALRALARVRDHRAFEALISATGETRPVIVGAAAMALGQQGRRDAVPALLRALQYPDGEVATEAARSLGVLRAREAVEPLRQMARRYERDYPYHHAANEAIARITSKHAVPLPGPQADSE